MSFQVRKLSHHTLVNPSQMAQSSLPQIFRQQPQKILFQVQCSQSNQIFTSTIVITNLLNHAVQFAIKQPKQRFFRVKVGKSVLAADQSAQLYVFYNYNASSNNSSSIKNNGLSINDQFVITCPTYMHSQAIPILVRSANMLRSLKKDYSTSKRRSSKTKENLKIIKLQTQNRPITENKRKAGIMYSISKIKNQQEDGDRSLKGRIDRFQRQFTKIVAFLRDKAIKNQIYRGEKTVTKQKHYEIISFNLTIQMMIKQQIKQQILTRYQTTKTKNGPSARLIFSFSQNSNSNSNSCQPNKLQLHWNPQINDNTILYRKGIGKLFNQVRNFVIYHRFKKMNKILSIYRNLREEENVEQPQTKIINRSIQNSEDESIEDLCRQSIIWNENDKDREYQLQLQQKKKHDYYCRKINKIVSNKKQRNLGSDFNLFTLTPRTIPLDFQTSQQKKSHFHTFDIKPRVGFDNWIAVEESTVYNHQLMGYGKMERNYQWECHPCYNFRQWVGINWKDKDKRHHNQTHKQKSHQQNQIIKILYTIKQNGPMDPKQQITERIKQYKQSATKFPEKYKQYIAQPPYPNYQPSLQHLEQYKHEYELDISKTCNNNCKGNGNNPYTSLPIQFSKQFSQTRHMKNDYFGYFQQPTLSTVDVILESGLYPHQNYNYNQKRGIGNFGLIYSKDRDDVIDFDQMQAIVVSKMQYLDHSNLNKLRNKHNNVHNKNSRFSSMSNMFNTRYSQTMNISAMKQQWQKKSRSWQPTQDSLLQKQQSRFQQQPQAQIQIQNQSQSQSQNQMQIQLQQDQTLYQRILQNMNKIKYRKLEIAHNKILSYNGFVKNNPILY